MVYVKSILAGLEAVVLCTVIYFVVFSLALNWDAPAGNPLTVDVISWVKQAATQSRYQLAALFFFAAGFYSKYRRTPK